MALNTDFRQKEILSALNAHLEDIWFYGLAEVPDEFNPRHAKQRWYRYYLFDDGFDLQGVNEAAKIFIGTHDFSNFSRGEGKDPLRTLDSITVTKEKDFIILDFKAQSFLWNMVRRIVKAISDVANGKLTLEEINHALSSDKKKDLGIAKPEPLILMDVKYDFNFPLNIASIEKMKIVLKEKLLDLRVEGLVYHLMLGIDE